MSNKSIDVIAMGRVAVDLYAEQLNTPLQQVESFRKYLGGSPGNISVGCRRLGLRSALLSKVGRDAMGEFILDTLAKEQVDIDGVHQSAQHLTALAFLAITPPSNFPLLFYRENCADMQLHAHDLDTQQIAKAHYLQISGTGFSTEAMRKTSSAAIAFAKAAQTKVVLDCDFRPVLSGLCAAEDAQNRYVADANVSQHFQSFLADCDCIVGTAEELMIAGGSEDVFAAIQNIRRQSHAAIVYKKGLEGSEVHLEDGRVIHADTFPVEVLNTLGAGDAFMSGMLLGLLEKQTWQQALSFGNACGAIVSTRHGCAPAMPDKKELQHFMAQYPSRGASVLADLT